MDAQVPPGWGPAPARGRRLGARPLWRRRLDFGYPREAGWVPPRRARPTARVTQRTKW